MIRIKLDNILVSFYINIIIIMKNYNCTSCCSNLGVAMYIAVCYLCLQKLNWKTKIGG